MDVTLDGESGYIESITLESGEALPAQAKTLANYCKGELLPRHC